MSNEPRRARILVVEDERLVALDIQRTLMELGYTLAGGASRGEDAVRKARSSHPDLVLMDICLQGEMDGIDAASQIQRELDIPIIYLSGFSDTETLRRAHKSSPSGFLAKPFKQAELARAVEVALERWRLGGKPHAGDVVGRPTAEMPMSRMQELLDSPLLHPASLLAESSLDMVMAAPTTPSATLPADSDEERAAHHHSASLIDVNAVVRSMEERLHRLVGGDIELSLRLASGLGLVQVERDHLEKVIGNLVADARQASPASGRIALETAALEVADHSQAGPVRLPHGSYVVLAVGDAGYEPDGGARAAFGPGPVLAIHLPRALAETILVVDHDESVRGAIARILAARGYRVLAARSGEQALELAASHDGPIDLIVDDLMVPGPGGPAIAAEVAAREAEPGVVFTASYPEQEVRGKGMICAAAPYVQKPFAPETLLRAVHELLDRRK
ncbi:MAG TPA: response regulator [Kofleriaceae bacterium]|nr:response regulator [Kofleriaceae bacterium]